MAVMRSNTLIDVWAKRVRNYFDFLLTPNATDRDEAFRERVIRISIILLTPFVLLSLISTILLYHNEWTFISFPALHVVFLIGCGLAFVLVVRGQLSASGTLMVLTLAISASMFILLSRLQGAREGLINAVPVFMFVPLFAALILPRNFVVPTAFLSAAMYGISQFVIDLDVLPAITLQAVPQTISIFLLLLVEAILLRQLRIEFDARLDAMKDSMLQTEVARQQAEANQQRAEQADKAKSQFLANMSHELRTPLNAIIGYSEAMIGGMAGTFTDQQKTLLGHIRHNGRRLLGLINDVLDLSKIEAGAVEVFLAPMSPRKTIEQTVESLRSLANEKGIQLVVKFDEKMPEVVLSDARKLEQITVNLLSNALKFTSEGGVYVGANYVNTETWQLSVRDTGAGMPTDAADYIFEPFKQVDSSVTRKHKGTGLGLSITKHLVERLEGSIKVDTLLGQGTTFTVTLPIAKVHEPEATSSEPIQSNVTL